MRSLRRKLIYLVGGGIFFSFSLKAQLPDYQLVPASLVKNFQNGLTQIKSGQYDSGFQSLDQALAELFRFQIQDLPAYALALIRAGESPQVPASVVPRLFEYSEYFAPHSSEAALARAVFYLRLRQFSFQDALAELRKMWKLLDYDLVMRVRLKAIFWLGLANFLKLGLLILSGIIICRYARGLVHWVKHLMPKNYQRLSVPILLIVLLVPVIIGARLWLVLAWPAIFCLIFSPRRLQGIFMAWLLAFSFSDLLEQNGKAKLISLNKGVALSQLNLGIGIADSNDLNILQAEMVNRKSPGLVLALSEAYRRAGDPKTSSELLIELLSEPEVSAIAHNQLGALYLEFKEFKEAVKVLESALERSPGAVEIYYNLSQAYNERSQYSQSEQAYQKARSLDERAVARFDLSKRLLGVSLFPVRMLVPAEILEKELLPPGRGAGIFGKEKPAIGLFIFGLGLLGSLALRNKIRICWYCGRVICPKCLPESEKIGVCAPCHQAFLSGRVMDPRLKMEQKGLVHNYHRLMGGIGLGLNLVLPGAGLLLEEMIISGLMVLLWPLLFLTSIVLCYLMPPLLMPGINFWASWLVIGGGIYLLMSLLAILLYLKLTVIEA